MADYFTYFRRRLTERHRIIELTVVACADAMLEAREHRVSAYDAGQPAAAFEIREQLYTIGTS
jgi:hypothetical protein